MMTESVDDDTRKRLRFIYTTWLMDTDVEY
jgi:hypothetical protein